MNNEHLFTYDISCYFVIHTVLMQNKQKFDFSDVNIRISIKVFLKLFTFYFLTISKAYIL